jgi:hypothetical protein
MGVRSGLYWVITILFIVVALPIAGCSSGSSKAGGTPQPTVDAISNPQPTADATLMAGGNLTVSSLYDYSKLHWLTTREYYNMGSYWYDTDYRYELFPDTYHGVDVMHVRTNESRVGVVKMTDDYYDLATGDRLFEQMTVLSPGYAQQPKNNTTVVKNIAKGNYFLTFNNAMLIGMSVPPVKQETIYIEGKAYNCTKYVNATLSSDGSRASFTIWTSPQVPAPVKMESAVGDTTITDVFLLDWG